MRDSSRFKMAYDLRQQGKTFKEIGEAVGLHNGSAPISATRARQLVCKWERLIDQNAEQRMFSGLSVRAINTLKCAGYESKEQVREDIHSRKLAPGSIPSMGRKSFDEICGWAEVNAPEKEKLKPLAMPTEKEIEFYTAKLKLAGFKVTKI